MIPNSCYLPRTNANFVLNLPLAFYSAVWCHWNKAAPFLSGWMKASYFKVISSFELRLHRPSRSIALAIFAIEQLDKFCLHLFED